VHVKKGGAEQRRSKVTNLGFRVNFTCLPRTERKDAPVFHEHHPILEELPAVPEPLRGERCLHN
jgi:hypothetical protein